MLNKSRNPSEKVALKQAVNRVRTEIFVLTTTRNELANLAALSTLRLTFTETDGSLAGGSAGYIGSAADSAKAILSEIGKFLAQATTFIFTLSPIWLPLAAIGWWLRRKSMKF